MTGVGRDYAMRILDAGGISADRTVEEVLRAWPVLANVFHHRRMACPGCAMARFMTVGEAARAYRLDTTALVADLTKAATEGLPAGPFPPAAGHPA